MTKKRPRHLWKLPLYLGFLAGAPLAASTGTISATPDPCRLNGNPCTSQISWHATEAPQALVTVSMDEGPDSIFACGLEGTADAPWIQLGHSYEFRLSTSTDCSAMTAPPLARITVSAIPASRPAPRPAIGLNKVDLAEQYLGNASNGGNGSAAFLRLTQAMAKKSILDAHDLGITYFRVGMTGYRPLFYGDKKALELWQTNPTAYWGLIDGMFQDLNASGIKIIPSFVWNPTQFPAMTGETLRALITNPNSQSYGLLKDYIRDFIAHYKNNPTLYFYELGNELNLSADLNIVKLCQDHPPFWDPEGKSCRPLEAFSTDELIAFTSRLAAYIRSLDPTRPISSGFGFPRQSAEHLRARPDGSPEGPDWTLDNMAEFEKNIADIHQGVDVVSVHFYNGAGDNDRLGITGQMNAALLDIVKPFTDSLGKELFVGELGDVKPFRYDTLTQSENSAAQFARNALSKIAASNIPYSAPWVWQFFQKSPFTLYNSPDDGWKLEPGYTDAFNSFIRQTNTSMGNPAPSIQNPDITPPRVVLTWPLDGFGMAADQLVYSIASDNSGTVSRVEFWVDGLLRSTKSTPPYQFQLDTTKLNNGMHLIAAKAYDASGNVAQSSASMPAPFGVGPVDNIVPPPPTMVQPPPLITLPPPVILPPPFVIPPSGGPFQEGKTLTIQKILLRSIRGPAKE